MARSLPSTSHPAITTSEIARFRKTVWAYFRKHPRRFPWRETTDPYCILVSEIMLQQTQTARVVGYYNRFIDAYPTIQHLAQASLNDVLRLWQGLGYNRRAKFLHDAAKEVVTTHAGLLPRSYDDLRSLSGIGDYTARAIRAFAYGEPSPLIETNIRTAIIHFFYVGPQRQNQAVHDEEIRNILMRCLPTKRRSRDWFYALMDYGVMLKASGVTAHRRSAHYSKQSSFKGSRRQIRGWLVRFVAQGGGSVAQFLSSIRKQSDKESQALTTPLVLTIADELAREKLISRNGRILKPRE